MTRLIHDQIAKDILAELLSPFGQVHIDQNIPAEPRRADVVFLYSPVAIERLEPFGIIPRMVDTDALFEAYRNPVADGDVVACMSKLCWAYHEGQREDRRKPPLFGALERRLWVITPSCPHDRLEGFGFSGMSSDWPPGFYSLAPRWRYGLVVVDALPESPDTLGLRLLGRGQVQSRAIAEVLRLPTYHPLRKNLLQILFDWRILLQQRSSLTEEDRELFMNLRMTVEEFDRAREAGHDEGLREGLQEGLQEGLLRGQEQGLVRGELIGKIVVLQELLEIPPTPAETLKALPLEELQIIARQLRDRLRS